MAGSTRVLQRASPSGSLHGWLWLVAAFAGNALGVRLRPMCDLPVETSR
jgi:hypothetical protein